MAILLVFAEQDIRLGAYCFRLTRNLVRIRSDQAARRRGAHPLVLGDSSPATDLHFRTASAGAGHFVGRAELSHFPL